MCNELEQVGLKDPVYHTNAFMLQVVIYNSKVGKTIVEKTSDSLKKLAVAVNKSLIDYQKPAIEQKKYNEPFSEKNLLRYCIDEYGGKLGMEARALFPYIVNEAWLEI